MISADSSYLQAVLCRRELQDLDSARLENTPDKDLLRWHDLKPLYIFQITSIVRC